MPIFEEEPSDYGGDTPPAPWEYEPELPPEIEQGENRPVTDPSDYETENWGSGEQPGDESAKWWVQNWAALDNDGKQPGDETTKDWVRNWTPSDDGGESDYRDNPELVYYDAYQPGSPYYGVSQFKAGAGGLGTPSEQAGADDGNAMGQTSQGTSEGVRQPEDRYRKLTQADAPWYDRESGRWIQPDSIVPDVRNPGPNRNPYVNNNPVNPANPSGPAIPEGLWASVQQAWRMLTDPRYARSQAFGGYVDPSGGQFANRDRWPTSPGDLIEEAGRSAAQANKFNFGPPLKPETVEAIKRVAQLGDWVAKNEGMSESADTYQAYVAGAHGEVFRYNDFDFDGFDGNALLDAKDHYEQFIDRKTGDWQWWFTGTDDMVDKAIRQLEAAQGAPIEWHFNEKAPAQRVKKLFSDEGIEGIEVIYDPMPADWGK